MHITELFQVEVESLDGEERQRNGRKTTLLKAVASQAAECSALPGGDPMILRKMEEYYCTRVLLRLALLPSRLSQAPLSRSRLKWVTSLINLLTNLPSLERKRLYGSALLGAWLDRALFLAENLTSASAAEKTAQIGMLDEHLARLSLLSLPFVFKSGVLPFDPYVVHIPTDGVSGPISVRWQLKSRQPGKLTVIFRFHKESMTATHEQEPLLEIPCSALEPQDTGCAIRIFDDDRVVLEARPATATGAISVSSILDFPNLGVALRNNLVPAESDLADIVAPIDGGLETLARIWPAGYMDVQHFCRIVTPVSSASSSRPSASHRGLRFIQMITVNRGKDLDHAEDLLHEAMHSKLWCLDDLTLLVENDGPALYCSPWRKDRRPIMGILLGTHAFLAVMELYRRASTIENALLSEQPIKVRLNVLRAEVGQALGELEKHAVFTGDGRILMDQMVKVYGRFSQ